MIDQPERREAPGRARARRRWRAGLLGALLAGAAGAATPAGMEEGRLIAVGAPPHRPHACMNCLGIDGMGDAASGSPRLAGLDAAYMVRQLEAYVNGTRRDDVMAPIAERLAAAERVAVSRYYQGLPPSSRAAPTGPPPDPALLQHGARLWAIGMPGKIQACVACHAGTDPAGRGGVYPAVAGQPAAYVVAQLRAWRAGTRRSDPFAVMQQIAARLDDQDIEALALYVSTLAPR